MSLKYNYNPQWKLYETIFLFWIPVSLAIINPRQALQFVINLKIFIKFLYYIKALCFSLYLKKESKFSKNFFHSFIDLGLHFNLCENNNKKLRWKVRVIYSKQDKTFLLLTHQFGQNMHGGPLQLHFILKKSNIWKININPINITIGIVRWLFVQDHPPHSSLPVIFYRIWTDYYLKMKKKWIHF